MESSLEQKKRRLEELKIEMEITQLENQLRAAKATGHDYEIPIKQEIHQVENDEDDKKWEEFLERMEARAERQERILQDIEKRLVAVEVNTDMFSALSGEISNINGRISMIDGNRTECAAAQMESQTMENIKKLGEKVENLNFVLLRGQQEEMKEMKKIIERMEKQGEILNEIGKTTKVNENLLSSFSGKVENTYNEIVKTKEKLEELHKSMEKTMTMTKETTSNNEKILNEIHVTVKEIGEERKKKEIEELKKKVDSLLTENLAPLKDRIHTENNQIKLEDGILLNFKEFIRIIENFKKSSSNSSKSQHALSFLQNPLWLLTPEDYEVECHNCKRMMIPLAGNISEDGISVRCPHCRSSLLCSPIKGFHWVWVSPCGHFQQVKKGEKPGNCLVCGGNVTYAGNWDDITRTPRRKQH